MKEIVKLLTKYSLYIFFLNNHQVSGEDYSIIHRLGKEHSKISKYYLYKLVYFIYFILFDPSLIKVNRTIINHALLFYFKYKINYISINLII